MKEKSIFKNYVAPGQALDGCKLPSNASKELSGTLSDLARKKEKIEERVKQLLEEQIAHDRNDDDIPSDRERQVERLQKQAEKIGEWLKENDPRMGTKGERKSNVTDNDSASMTSSHGVTRGYNSQALVDSMHQVIVHGEVFGNGQDHVHVPPLLNGAKKNLEDIGYPEDHFQGKTFTADSINLKACEENGLDAYIPDNSFRKRDARFDKRRKKRKHYNLEDFVYNEKEDYYICPNNKLLHLKAKHLVISGNAYRRYGAEEEDCKVCSKRDK